MVNLYLDTSAMVKLFVNEEESELVKSGVRRANIVTTSVIAYAECRSAFSRRYRAGDIDPLELRTIVDQLIKLWPGLERIAVTQRIARHAGDLAETHALRGFDAVHLATAFRAVEQFGTVAFLGFDERLNHAAAEAGLTLFADHHAGA